MDNELRKKILDYIIKCGDNWDKYYTNPNLPEIISYDQATDQIDALYQEHYAEMAEKGGLILSEEEQKPCWDEWTKTGEESVCTSLVPDLLKSQLAKVMPWHEAKVAESVKAAKLELINEIINDLNQAVVFHNEVKPNGIVMLKAGALHDMTVKYVKQRQSLKEVK